MPSPETPAQIYDEAYYHSHLGEIPYERNEHWLGFFGGIADNLIRSLRPRRVFDAGCAWGFLVEALHDRGVEAWGRDISDFAISHARPDMQAFCEVGSIGDPLPGHYDLVTCIEVVEHMAADEADDAIRNMCSSTDVILFSSSPSDFQEESHINVHPPLHWLRKFAVHGFVPDIGYDSSFVSPHSFLVRRSPVPLPEEVLVLFSEKLRWSREWVASHQAFCIASDRIRELEKRVRVVQNADAKLRAEELQRRIEEWRVQNLELRREIVRSEDREVRNGVMTSRLREALVLEENRREMVERERDEARVQMEEIAQAIMYRDRELDSIQGSPGWKLITKYRGWIDRNRQRPAVRKYMEPAMLRALQMAGMGQPVQALPPGDPPEPAPISAPRHISFLPVAQDTAPVADEALATESVPVHAAPSETDYERWIREFEPSAADLTLQCEMAAQFSYRPLISIVTPVYKVPVDILRELVDSVFAQTYDNWELCFVHGWTGGREAREYLTAAAAAEPRIRVALLNENKGISGNSNEALKLVQGEYVALLDHDDTLPPFALYEMLRALNSQGPADFLYSDKDQLAAGPDNRRISPLFKSDWSPETILSANYLTHLCLLRTDLIRQVGGWHSETDGAQDWDLFLRVIAAGRKVIHVPGVLYHWRQIPTSVAGGGMAAKPYAAEAQARTLRNYFKANGWNADIRCEPDSDPKIRWAVPSGAGVSVILVSPPDDLDVLAFAHNIAAGAGQRRTEVLFLQSGEADPAQAVEDPSIRPIPPQEGESFHASLNRLAALATGDILIFADRAVRPLEPDWIEEITGPLQIAGVGLVGGKFAEEKTMRIRHAGLVFNDAGEPEYIFRGEPEHVFAEFGAASWNRNWTAVCGACFAIRRSTWESLGGFPDDPAYPRLDIDLCLRVQFDAKLRVMYNPCARFTQSAAAGLEHWLGPDKRGWYIRANFPAGDPFLNPHIVLRDSVPGLRRREFAELKATDYASDSRVFVNTFDFDSAAIGRSRASTSGPATQQIRSVTWFIPEFTNPYYGGIHTILRFADYFARKHHVQSHFAVLGNCHPNAIQQRIAMAFPDLSLQSKVTVIRSMEAINSLPPCDGAISTLWTTAYAALRFEGARRKFYFVQDFEPYFYPAGSASALVEATWDFGYHGICNTVGLRDLYVARGGEADWFDPSIDPRVFHPTAEKRERDKPWTVFCYMRPGHARNGFELIAAAMRIVKARLQDDVRIITAGADWNPAGYGLEGVLHNLGDIGYGTSGALYRSCDAGVVMMMTCHPSYLPFELMASGALVVTNRNPHTQWLLHDRENCLLSEGSASCIAETVIGGLEDRELRGRIVQTASELIAGKYSDWDGQAEKVYQCLIRQS